MKSFHAVFHDEILPKFDLWLFPNKLLKDQWQWDWLTSIGMAACEPDMDPDIAGVISWWKYLQKVGVMSDLYNVASHVHCCLVLWINECYTIRSVAAEVYGCIYNTITITVYSQVPL